MRNMISAFFADRRGATSIEYALIAAFIGIVIVSSVTNVGNAVSNVFDSVTSGF